MNRQLRLLFLLLSPLAGLAQVRVDDLNQVRMLPGRTVAQTAVQTAGTLLGKPYVHHTLEGSSQEKLIVNVQAFDCTTFIETTLALALAEHELPAHYGITQLDAAFRKQLTRIRYRNGLVNGYGSRLHYLSDWLRDNEQKGIIEDITQAIGGIQVQKAVYYMTAASHKYPALADPQVLSQISRIQNNISQQPFFFIPTKQFKAVESRLQEGDIIMLTAARPGLDMRHVGYATWRGGILHLLHASSDHRKVMLTTQPLATYLLANKRLSGVRVARIRPVAGRMALHSPKLPLAKL